MPDTRRHHEGPDEVVETDCHVTDMGRWDQFNGSYGQYVTPPMRIPTTISCGLVPPSLVECPRTAWSPTSL
ncbi:MAG: putative endoribonuclease [Modestobacter sp.]|nr:putative endoribonuclease [Modestobacter sp.]